MRTCLLYWQAQQLEMKPRMTWRFWPNGRRGLIALFFIVGIGTFVEAASESPSFQQCITEHKAQDASADEHKLIFSNSVIFRCAGVFLDNNSSLISAIATVVIAWLTISLASATSTQAQLTRDSIDLSRAQIVVLHRPRLRVRNVVVHPSSNFFPALFAANDLIGGQLFMANIGGTTAHIKEALCNIFWTNQPLPMERPYEGEDGFIFQNLTIAAGSSHPLPFSSNVPLDPQVASVVSHAQVYN
jgi:hypothetical protein